MFLLSLSLSDMIMCPDDTQCEDFSKFELLLSITYANSQRERDGIRVNHL